MQEPEKFKRATTIREVRREAMVGPLKYGDPRYVDFGEVRGRDVVRRFLKLLDVEEGFVHIVYAGHRGSGKTTELNHLRYMLEEKGDTFVVYKDAYPDLAVGDLQYTDLLLYIAQMSVEGVGRSHPVREDLLEDVERWFYEVTKIEREEVEREIGVSAEAEAGLQLPLLGKLLTRLTARIKGRSADLQEIRLRLQSRPDELIDNINRVFLAISEILNEAGKSKLLLMIDSLDRQPSEIMERAFVQWAHMFTQLNVDLILTVPIGMIYSPRGESILDTGFSYVVLPIIKVRRREQSWDDYDEKSVDKLREVIEKRVEVDKVFTDPNIVKEMALMSGGSLRELLRLLEEAALEAEGERIDREAFERGRRNLYQAFTANLRLSDYAALRNIHCRKSFDRTEEELRTLFYRFALEYDAERWADVHPLIYYSREFQDYLKEHPCEGPGR